MRCIAIADIASRAGEREPSWTMPVARPIVDVLAARKASGVRASGPHTSGTHTDEAPSRSASTTSSTCSGTLIPPPRATRMWQTVTTYRCSVTTELRFADCPTTEATLDIAAPPEAVWALVSDIDAAGTVQR